MAAHTGIGTLPILYFGNKQQKKNTYRCSPLPNGKHVIAFRTQAAVVMHWQQKQKLFLLLMESTAWINGQKMWITNAGFADLFIVFAQVDGDKFTGFIIEKSYNGITLGEEEHKMGIKGSSTRQVFFNDTKVPVEMYWAK